MRAWFKIQITFNIYSIRKLIFNFKNIFSLNCILGLNIIAYRVCLTFYTENLKGLFFIFSIFPICLIFLYILFPFKIFLNRIRLGIILEILRNYFPFGKNGVKFKDFVIGDILTSLTRPFANLTLAFCLLD